MLALIQRMRHHNRDDSGAVLVTVVVVMLVGFVIAVTIAASVFFTIGANQGNKSSTQAFIAAESGRDAIIAAVSDPAACSSLEKTADMKSFRAYNLESESGYDATKPTYDVTAQTGQDLASLSAACPDATTTVIQVTSTGSGADSSSTTIESDYAWLVTQKQPGGVMTYFSGEFKATKADYKGDLVIRPDPDTGIGNFDCNSGGGTTIDGNLWVLAGYVDLNNDCTITGTIFASGRVTIASAKSTIGGDIRAVGDVSITANDSSVAGNVYTDGTFTIGKNAAGIGGKYESGGISTIDKPAQVGNLTQSVQRCATTPDPATPGLCISDTPGTTMIDPSLAQVLLMTQWMDISASRNSWGSDVYWLPAAPCDGTDVRPAAMAAIDPTYTKVGVDYTSCTGDVTIKLGNGAITRDVVFLVKPTVNMDIDIDTITTTATPPDTPQLVFIHGDAGPLTNHIPQCGVTPSASDSIDIATATDVRMMMYTPCGIGMANHTEFTGQYYSNDDGNVRWVQPVFKCADMTWGPIDLGCAVVAEAATGGGTPPPPTLSLGPLTRQIENPAP
ncbi:hypothetical protein [Microbacterium sp. B35-30]|uniref:hypothetical protein n=1 Tax=Microbacterium sp. B35-30 TaxID=1962642 RepID=UPI0013CF4EC4|nr:hypothetical protein [Microbacterium sp. B35-30]KAF2416375.1 hypothetical protein B2K11_16370 [Microbacterium sp. B35-30]